jgi:hypothetical protein
MMEGNMPEQTDGNQEQRDTSNFGSNTPNSQPNSEQQDFESVIGKAWVEGRTFLPESDVATTVHMAGATILACGSDEAKWRGAVTNQALLPKTPGGRSPLTDLAESAALIAPPEAQLPLQQSDRDSSQYIEDAQKTVLGLFTDKNLGSYSTALGELYTTARTAMSPTNLRGDTQAHARAYRNQVKNLRRGRNSNDPKDLFKNARASTEESAVISTTEDFMFTNMNRLPSMSQVTHLSEDQKKELIARICSGTPDYSGDA